MHQNIVCSHHWSYWWPGINMVQIYQQIQQWSRSTLQWRHNEHGGISNHQPHDCLLDRRSKKTSKLRVTGLCEGNSLVTGKFPKQRASNAENVSIWWRHHESHMHFCMGLALQGQFCLFGNNGRNSFSCHDLVWAWRRLPNPSYAKMFVRNIKIIFTFSIISRHEDRIGGLHIPSSMKTRTPCMLCIQYHGCWCSVNVRSHGFHSQSSKTSYRQISWSFKQRDGTL